jgi:putative peptide zinc metalloprotease protein
MNYSPALHVREPITAVLKLREDLVFAPDLTRDRPGYTIEDPLRGKFFRLGVPESTFLAQLDGRRSIAEAVGRAARHLGADALRENEALALCHWALANQLVQSLDGDGPSRIAAAAAEHERQRTRALANPLCMRIPLIDPDRLLSRIAPWCDWVFSWPALAAWIGLVGYAIYLAVTGRANFESAASVETAHGLACKRLGGTVGSAGVTLLFFMPLAYVNVTSSWRFTCKWQRIATAAAGIYVELFVAALAAIVWANSPPGLTQSMAMNIALTAGVSTLVFNANPLVRFDGYFILSDLLDLPNLASCSQQWLADSLQACLLGQETAAPVQPRVKAWFIRLYAVAALAWRVMFFLTLALTLIANFGHLGGLLAGLLLGFAWGVPAVQVIRRLRQMSARQPIRLRRIATSLTVVAAALAVLGAVLARRARVVAPAVVEYAPLNIVRASAPGFVKEILVASGDVVVQGQPIALLRNDDLKAELADLELAREISISKSRPLIQSQELAKLQVEAADRAAIEKKIAELKSLIASLTVRAAVAGRVYARNFDALRGRYLQAGEELAVLGSEEAKELLVAVPQEEVALFETHLGFDDVHVRTTSGDSVVARLASVDPRGSTELPHPALSASVGGPLAVKPAAASEEAAGSAEHKCELISPVFQGRVALTAVESRRFSAGQLATISFRTSGETIAQQLYRGVQTWTGRILHGSP